jgi:hypothetical protein
LQNRQRLAGKALGMFGQRWASTLISAAMRLKIFPPSSNIGGTDFNFADSFGKKQ